MPTVLVVGNGFDLALGYDSGYTHFVNTHGGSIAHYFWPFKKPDESKFNSESFHQYFYEYFISHLDDSDRINWIDLEGGLYKYANSKRGLHISEELAYYDKWSFSILVKALYLYLYRHEDLKYKYHPPKGEDKCVVDLLKALSKDKTFTTAYTFNYTDLKKRFIEHGEFKENKIPTITYINGSIEESTQENPSIVLGINTDITLPHEYSFLQKINNPNADAGNLVADLVNADEIIFYGLSMGKIDFEYFQSFFQSIVNAPFSIPQKHITIFTRGGNMVSSIIQNLDDMGVCIRSLKEHSHFNIIDTHEAEFEDNGHFNAFQKLLVRLKNKQPLN